MALAVVCGVFICVHNMEFSLKNVIREKLEIFWKKLLTICPLADIINHVVRYGTNIWGISSAGSPSSALTHPHN